MTDTSRKASRDTYHHGDLRAALITSATALLETGQPFSLRAVARDAGVSPTAPYRHFTDRESLESAVAVEGFRSIGEQLAAAGTPTTIDGLADLAVVYVNFALDHPAVFKLMFGQECDDSNNERVIASGQLHVILGEALSGLFPESEDESLSVGAWALVQGLAFLHLDGKLPAEPRSEAERRVRSAVRAMLAT